MAALAWREQIASLIQECEATQTIVQAMVVQDAIGQGATLKDVADFLERWYIKRGHRLYDLQEDGQGRVYLPKTDAQLRKDTLMAADWEVPLCPLCQEFGGHDNSCTG